MYFSVGRSSGRPARHGDDDIPERDRVGQHGAGELGDAPARHARRVRAGAALPRARRHPLRHLHQVSHHHHDNILHLRLPYRSNMFGHIHPACLSVSVLSKYGRVGPTYYRGKYVGRFL